MSSIDTELEHALEAAQRAMDSTDAILRRLDQEPREVSVKTDGSLLTRADLAVEDAVRAELSPYAPGTEVFGEERSGRAAVRALLAGEVDGWLVDPIDHTRHFARSDPEFGTLLAYVRDGEPVVGVISAPLLGIRAWARRGGGAFVNGEAVRVSDRHDLARAEVAFAGFVEWTTGAPHRNLGAVLARSSYPHGTRGGFLQHVRVADGSVDVAVEPWGEAWDLLPGALIVAEAGGRATALNGGPAGRASDGGFVISNGPLHDEVLALLRTGGPGADGGKHPE
ncbi:inositol monophosphatase family protein [Streptomyces griseoloalbus]|uniref:Histidinol-phosphatase n=1 Tax=Streptomyces griseoloalbus TaxID=67303 RepID=A0A7W8BXX1_9ACTN|nr:inositol monophosphatase [Streptomyces albaduncus]MBB5130243.1 histidinol-phosphatase [Streptomyces albaduncus]GGV87530.1 histidinol-phosphatase [Streptomyces griseoloalbus]GGW81319.1 histidinol-phosphatase [Streptomyces albaduncus]